MERKTPPLHPSFLPKQCRIFLHFQTCNVFIFWDKKSADSPHQQKMIHTVVYKHSFCHLNGFRKAFISSPPATWYKDKIWMCFLLSPPFWTQSPFCIYFLPSFLWFRVSPALETCYEHIMGHLLVAGIGRQLFTLNRLQVPHSANTHSGIDYTDVSDPLNTCSMDQKNQRGC